MKALIVACCIALCALSACKDGLLDDDTPRIQPMRDDPCLSARGDDECGDEVGF